MSTSLIIVGIFFVTLVTGFRLGVAFAKTYVCSQCQKYDVEQVQKESEEERFSL